MAEKKIEIIEMRAGDVKIGFGNPRKITKKKKEELRRSIETFGDFGSFIIDDEDNVIAGNQRLSVIKEMDPDKVILCKRLIGYSEAELRAINIKDNTHSGEWDVDLLADWTADLTIDLGLEEVTKKEMEERRFTVVAAAHKLKDLEDVCHNIGIMHKGGILHAGDMRKKAKDLVRFQCVFGGQGDVRKLLQEHSGESFTVLACERKGYFTTLTVKGDKGAVMEEINRLQPVFVGETEMSLEEIFLAEMEEAGYDIGRAFL